MVSKNFLGARVLVRAGLRDAAIPPRTRPGSRVNHATEAASAALPSACCADQLVCTRCGAVTRLDLFETLAGVRSRAEARGHAVEFHSLTVYGRCWLCRAPEVCA